MAFLLGPELAVWKTIDLFLEGQKLVFVKKYLGQTNEQKPHFNEWPISDFHGEVDSIL
jgi:hypothetical protein